VSSPAKGNGGTPFDAVLPSLDVVAQIARRAGALIMQVYGEDFAVRHKDDASPLTVADESAEALIVPALQALVPGWAVVAEEAMAGGHVPVLGRYFWLVDPLDGTREFVARNGEFTVNIALVDGDAPVLGVVYAPALGSGGVLYAGQVGQGAWRETGGADGSAMQRNPVRCRARPTYGAVLACSRSHGDEGQLQAWLTAQQPPWPGLQRVVAGSALKFGQVAEGRADVYPRFGRTMEWDTAAGHALLRAAGGDVLDLQGRPLRYGKPGFESPHFVARGLA
jgi:3'(2'), 5'-bisphosphate nucleotidase